MKINQFIRNSALLSFVFLLSLNVLGQRGVSLRIGDTVPPLKYSKWIKGAPINSMDGEKLYVFEFWATWCGPCRAAMPHLSKLQQLYKDKIVIVGVDIWEDKKNGKPHDVYIPAVEKFVESNDRNMGYSIMIDNNEQFMGNHWMKAAGQEGIPSTFIVKDQILMWIGHPMALDSILPKIISGNYNINDFREKIEAEVSGAQNLVEAWRAVSNPIEQVIQEKKYDSALTLIERAIQAYPAYKTLLNYKKFSILLRHVKIEDAVTFGDQWEREDGFAADAIVGAVMQEPSLPSDVYLWAAKKIEATISETDPFGYHRLAPIYAKAGDWQKAITTEKKAIKIAKSMLKGAQQSGSVTPDIIDQFNKKLADYKNRKL